MLLNYQHALVPYNSLETIQMVPGVSGYVPSNRGEDSGEMELAFSSRENRHKNLNILDEKYEKVYSRSRRITSFGMADVGSRIDIYA